MLGVHIINVKKMWEKLLLAARVISAIENPSDVCAISARPFGQVSWIMWFVCIHCITHMAAYIHDVVSLFGICREPF